MLKTILRVCFHDRRLQYMEKELIDQWKEQRPSDRILDVDIPLSYGIHDVRNDAKLINRSEFFWDPTKETGVFIRVSFLKCTIYKVNICFPIVTDQLYQHRVYSQKARWRERRSFSNCDRDILQRIKRSIQLPTCRFVSSESVQTKGSRPKAQNRPRKNEQKANVRTGQIPAFV